MPSTATKHRILIVDPDPTSLAILQVSFNNAGLGVIAVSTGQKAWAVIEAEPIDLVIADAQLPDLPVLELHSHVQQRGAGRVPFILVSGRPSVSEKASAFELGIDDYLTKPVYPREIITSAVRLLQRSLRQRLESGGDERTPVTGRLSEVGVTDLIQTIEINRRSGIVRLVASDGRQGQLYFRDGGIVADTADFTQAVKSLHALAEAESVVQVEPTD